MRWANFVEFVKFAYSISLIEQLAAVEWRQGGNTKLFSCPYHAWSYDTQKRLRGVPGEVNFCGLDKVANGLSAIALNERGAHVLLNQP